MSKGKEYKKQEESNKEKKAMIGYLEQSIKDIDLLGADENHIYKFERVKDGVHNVRQSDSGEIVIQTSGNAFSIHEITHVRQALSVEGGFQFDTYGLMMNPGVFSESNKVMRMAEFEIDAYKAQYSFNYGSMPRNVSNIFNIDIHYVGSIRYNGQYGYKSIHELSEQIKKGLKK